MTRSRITTALLILEIAFAGLLFAGTVGRAVSLSDLGISRPRSLDVEIISDEQGLGSPKYEICKGDIFQLFSANLDKKLERWAEDTSKALLRTLKKKLVTEAICAPGNWLSKFTKFGFRVTGFFSQCDTIGSSSIEEQMRLELKDRLKSNFLVRCTAETGRRFVTNTVVDMVQTQGLDGGMAAATDWSYIQNVRPKLIAQRQWWAQLANTNICPWMRQEVLDRLGVPQSYRDNPPPVNSLNFVTNERAPLQLRLGCTNDNDFDISDMRPETLEKRGGYLLLDLLSRPENNPEGFIAAALAEFEALKIARTDEARTQLGGGGGGYTGTYGECAKDPDGNCYDDGAMKQVPAAVRDIVKSDLEGYFNQPNTADGENGFITDFAAQLQIRLLDMANSPLPLKLELGLEQDESNFTPIPEPSLPPGATPTPDPNDPACTGGDPRCTCVTDDPSYRNISSQIVGPAILEAMQANSAFFVLGTNQIAPGTDFRLVLQAVCDRIGIETCHPSPGQDDEIVLVFGDISTSFDIITADGYIRTNGGNPVAACSEGVQ